MYWILCSSTKASELRKSHDATLSLGHCGAIIMSAIGFSQPAAAEVNKSHATVKAAKVKKA
jgi:hypothetical protein